MIKIILHGCNGRMGQVISSIVKEKEGLEIVAGVDSNDSVKNDYKVFTNLKDCDVDADVVIDFSNVKAVNDLIDYCVEKKTALVLCTTGLEKEHLDKIDKASKEIAILRSANMSLGINMMCKLLSLSAKLLYDADFDIEIIEKHHRMKLDAPSGTALTLADTINEALDNKCDYVYDRTDKLEKRSKNEIGISAIRGGTIVGEHEVIFAGNDEVISIKHSAFSRNIFANGAISAAEFLYNKPAGMYSMNDLV